MSFEDDENETRKLKKFTTILMPINLAFDVDELGKSVVLQVRQFLRVLKMHLCLEMCRYSSS